MKKSILLGMLSLITFVSFTSCDDDDTTIKFPIWKGFQIYTSSKTFTPGSSINVKAGDTLRIKAILDKGGQYLNQVKYKWYLTVDTLDEKGIPGAKDLSYSIESNSAHRIHMNDEPTAYFVIPANVAMGTAKHQFSFNVDYSNAAVGVPASGSSTTQEGYFGGVFNYQAASTLYSKTTNNFSATITIE